MINQTYLAGQYLAAASISFLKKEADDSHTNLGFSTEDGCLSTRPLNASGDVLALNYNTFSLEWRSTNARETFRLDGSTHEEVVRWLERMTQNSDLDKAYSYAFHYEPTYSMTSGFTFKLVDPGRLRELMHFRILAQLVLRSFLEEQKLTSEIRIWPHHFDTGAFASFQDDSGRAVGLGLSIPDTVVNDFYFYISVYEGHDALDTSSFTELTQGEWRSTGFKGAVLPATGTNRSTAGDFFKEAMEAYKK